MVTLQVILLRHATDCYFLKKLIKELIIFDRAFQKRKLTLPLARSFRKKEMRDKICPSALDKKQQDEIAYVK